MDAVQRLKSIINIEKWQLLQDALSDVTGMAIVTSDYRGVPITEHSGCRELCRAAREDPGLTRLCQKCDSRGGLEAIRLKAPYIYRCHLNLVDAAIPIIVDNSYLGSILIGQILLADRESSDRLEMICPETAFASGREACMNGSRETVPVFSLARVEVVVNMLFHLCNYLVSEAAEKKPNGPAAAARASEEPAGEAASAPLTGNNMLDRVFSHMNVHRSERLSLNEMARLCHVSPSYFSRVFHRETGETYSAFLIRKRVEWGKDLLVGTDMKMAQIAEESGFSDAGHFIRSFKKHEGVTPSLFRGAVIGGSPGERD